ncbi:MAG TPA: hypothetical protein VGU02_03180 [Gaiellaceae bacterium]|nr:hypothetical protein [Gaiellaceae bacterium]
MRDVPVYRDMVRGASPVVLPHSLARRRAGGGLAAAVLLSLVAALVTHRLPLKVPLGGGHHGFALSNPHSFVLGGSTTAHVGDLLTERGALPPGVTGTVVLLARWNGGPWLNVASSTTNQGSYFLSFKVGQAGVLDLQMNFPNGDQGTATINVAGPSVGSASWPTTNGTA